MNLILALSLLFSVSALAAEVDLAKSYIEWEGSKVVGDKHNGKLKLKSATVKEVNGKIESGEFVVDMDSLSVDGMEDSGGPKLIGHLKSADFFDTAKFPVAKYTVKSVAKNVAKGDLTIKDKTVATSIPFKEVGDTLEGSTTFDRTKFGVIYNSKNFLKNLVADKVIKDEVSVKFKIFLVK